MVWPGQTNGDEMRHKIRDTAALPMVWNNDENIWEIDFEQIRGPLAPAEMIGDQVPSCPCMYGADAAAGIEHDEVWGRATAIPFPSAEDVARMLGAAVTQPGPNKNLQKGYRPVSDGLVHMIEGAIDDSLEVMPDRRRAVLVQQLVPIFASVDQNAHERGVAEGRRAVQA